MKSKLVLALLPALILCGVARGDEEKPVRTITVTGSVETKVAPDLIMWSISLSDKDEDMRKVMESNEAKARAVLALREELGISEGDIETGNVSIHRSYDRDKNGNRIGPDYYTAYRSIAIRQHDLKEIDKYLKALVACGEMDVSFSFSSSKMYEIRAETRLKAMRAARDKAAAMAEAVGAELGPVITIDEHPRDGRANFGYANNIAVPSVNASDIDFGSSTFIPGAIPVKMTVYTVFELK